MAPGFARIHRDTSPINGGGKDLIYTLRAIPAGMALLLFQEMGLTSMWYSTLPAEVSSISML